MFKIGMFNKEYYKLDYVTKAISEIPTSQVIIVFAFAMVGACLVIGGFFAGASRIGTDIESIPEYLLLIIIGWMLFTLLLPIAYIVYLFKEIQLLKAKLEDINRDLLKTPSNPESFS